MNDADGISNNQRRALNAGDVEKLLPHRHPFLFLKDAKIVTESEAIGLAFWEHDHPILHGHFPGRPIVPGVCQIEAIAQLAGILISAGPANLTTSKLSGVLVSIRASRFSLQLFPDEPLNLTVAVRSMASDFFRVHGKGCKNGKLVCSVELVLALRELGKLDED